MRDRDADGRARNARPRDAYGRPLPHDASGEERVPDDYAAAPAEGLAEAQRLLDADRPFHAHEVLEAMWKSCPPQERDLWKGLAQFAVGLTHIRRENPKGATALLTRAADLLTAAEPRYGVDPATLALNARDLVALIETDGLSADVITKSLSTELTAKQPPVDGRTGRR
jgi:uncharacterized protein